MNKQIISAHELARNVIKTYEMANTQIVNVEFHNTENGRSKHRATINGTLEVRLHMHYERMSSAVYNIMIQIHDGKWLLTTTGYLDEVNVEYSNDNTEFPYNYLDLKKWKNDFINTVYQLKVAEVHGIVIVP